MSLLGPDRMVVGRSVVDRADAKCIHCAQPIKYGVNVFTPEGLREVGISGMCETCFDGLFSDDEGSDE